MGWSCSLCLYSLFVYSFVCVVLLVCCCLLLSVFSLPSILLSDSRTLRALTVFSNLSLSITLLCLRVCTCFLFNLCPPGVVFPTAHWATNVLTNCSLFTGAVLCSPLSGYSFGSESTNCSLPTGRRVPTALWATIVINR